MTLEKASQLYVEGSLEDAIDYVRLVVTSHPDNKEAQRQLENYIEEYLDRGDRRYADGSLVDALDHTQKVLAAYPGNKRAQAQMSKYLLEAQEKDCESDCH